MQVGDYVKLPYDGKGIIIELIPSIWFEKFLVEVTEDSTMYNNGEIIDFKKEQLKVIPC